MIRWTWDNFPALWSTCRLQWSMLKVHLTTLPLLQYAFMEVGAVNLKSYGGGGGWLGDFVLPPPSPFNSHPGLKIVGQRGHFSLTYFYFIFLETVFPSQPNLEEVEYEFIEDVREGFFGKAIVKVFWNASQGS